MIKLKDTAQLIILLKVSVKQQDGVKNGEEYEIFALHT
jgi:hypothetical protein